MDAVREHRRLTRLNLASNKLSAAGAEAVARALEPVADGGGLLKWLRRMPCPSSSSYHCWFLFTNVPLFLTRCAIIVDFNPLKTGSEVILGAVSRNNTLTKLDLKNTSMTAAAFSALITIGATNTKLRHLSLANNPKHMSMTTGFPYLMCLQ
jgi:hypothetical protein